MKKRWIIRSLFIGLLTLCVVAWVGSYWKLAEIGYGWTKNIVWLRAEYGRIYLASSREDWPGLYLGLSSAHWYARGERDQHVAFHFLGFSFKHSRGPWWSVSVPLWFLTVPSALLLRFVWRKTRAKPRGFPVEVVKSGENPTRPTHDDPSAAS